MKIYIYWEEQEYFTSFEDVQDYYKQHYDYITFSDFLAEHYEIEDIFNFTETKRESVVNDYKNSLADEVEDWIRDYCDVVEIEVECKEKTNE